jgi:hypothetical protein
MPHKTRDADFYLRLLGEVVELPPEETLEEKWAREEEEGKYVAEPTQGKKQQAFHALRQAKSADRFIEAIIDKYIPKPEGLPDPSAEADEMRTNPDLRYELGSYLLRDKLPQLRRDRPHSVPSRVYIGREKSPNHPGYRHLGKINSDEYSVMLVLAMLDGTFEEPGPGDPIVLDEHGRPELGQHRAAALLLLNREGEYHGY